ncbi:MAG: tRNA uridine-5-carboxymethylaminomethyl(34) synthesis GTPase MnmE [Mycoplasmataceae bacterium]|jgi:tRNA modification GTPase|nr:tRNA uridine-5-carboxymethylaminomethyl(34) synthesis GTPase MnmE [Mycoplasmataceae bacterium]
MENFNETIVALATGMINCAIHIIRVSGEKTYEILNKVCKKQIKKKGYTFELNDIVEKNNSKVTKIDNVILVKYIAPHSFTGEDLIEINCHGGIFLANKIINLLIKNGCKLAKPGQFSKQAFLNKKINLNQANAINNLIKANNDFSLSLANNGLSLQTVKKLENIEEDFFKILGQVEINIDYPEYDDIPNLSNIQIIKLLKEIKDKLIQIDNISSIGLKYSNGINVCILGKPNVGKSSLLNALTSEEKAIVSNICGTTRDIIETKINIDGITLNIFDTAGIRRKNINKIEKIGIEKTLDLIKKVDVILLVFDGSKKINENDKYLIEIAKKTNKKIIYIINKNDLIKKNKGMKKKNNELKNPIYISAKNNDILTLIKELKKQLPKFNLNDNSIVLQSQHSISILKSIINNIDDVLKIFKEKESIDIIMEKLHQIHNDFLTLLGKNEDYDFIINMFANFCLGK